MEVTFYNVSDGPSKLVKDISSKIGTERVLRPTDDINVLNPTIVVGWNDAIGNQIVNANYCYIDTFKRYYWISCSVDTAKRIIVSGRVDYLMSWADEIKQCECNVVRSNIGHPTYIIDKKYPIDTSRFYTLAIDFPHTSLDYNNGISNPQFIIITR